MTVESRPTTFFRHPELSCAAYHLGAISSPSNAQWLWKRSLTGPLNGKGNFDPFCENGGQEFVVVDDRIFAIYSGEFWRNSGQANQIYHYKTDGTFVGQFGTPKDDKVVLDAPGAALNMFTLSGVKIGSSIYLYTNDEGSRGTHRWKITVP